MSAATAITNAKIRTRIGWPLVLLTIALYAPLGGMPRLGLIGTALFFLVQNPAARTAARAEGRAGTGPKTPKPASGPKQPARPKRPAAQPATAQARVDRPVKAKPGTTVPRERGADGRWMK